MESTSPARVLVVAHKTAPSEALVEAVRKRAQAGPARFTLLVPRQTRGLHRVVDPEDQATSEAQEMLDTALPLLLEASASPVDGLIGDCDPVAAVEQTISLQSFDEVIISTLSPRISRWLRLDLPSKVAGMGLPVTTVTPSDAEADPASSSAASEAAGSR